MSKTMNAKAFTLRGEMIKLAIADGATVQRVDEVLGHADAIGCVNAMCQWYADRGIPASESLVIWSAAARTFDAVSAR